MVCIYSRLAPVTSCESVYMRSGITAKNFYKCTSRRKLASYVPNHMNRNMPAHYRYIARVARLTKRVMYSCYIPYHTLQSLYIDIVSVSKPVIIYTAGYTCTSNPTNTLSGGRFLTTYPLELTSFNLSVFHFVNLEYKPHSIIAQ